MLFGNLAFSIGFFFMAKTPFYCLEKKDYEGFKKSILYIAQKNDKLTVELESDVDHFIDLKRDFHLKNKR